MKFLSSSALFSPGMVKTTSRLRAWWLTTFRHYHVEQIISHPHKYALGRLRYTRTWLLKP